MSSERQRAPAALLLPLPEEMGTAAAVPVGAAEQSCVVTYANGQLTIDARNSTLAEVLKLVAQKTGATIEVPPGSGLERIVEHSGPGEPNDVLTRLLNGSAFNFVIVSSPQHPSQLTEVLLTLQRVDTDVQPTPAQPKALASSVLWTPPENTAAVPLPPQYNSNLVPPKEQLTPDALSEIMRAKAHELREKAQQEAPPQ